MRNEQLKRYLLGDYKTYDKEMYRIVRMYKELEKANALGRGPIEMQYAQYEKTTKFVNAASAATGKKKKVWTNVYLCTNFVFVYTSIILL